MQFHINISEKQEEMDGFLAKQKMLKLVQDKVENLEVSINIVKHIAKAV